MQTLELEHLDEIISKISAGGIVVEIGSLYGRSAYCLAKSNPGITLYCIDYFNVNLVAIPPYHASRQTFQYFTKDCPNIVPVQLLPEQVMPRRLTMVDMVFIDAVHRNPRDWEFIDFWLPKIKPGGILCGHDCSPAWPDVIVNAARLEELGYARLPMRPGSSIYSFVIQPAPTSSVAT